MTDIELKNETARVLFELYAKEGTLAVRSQVKEILARCKDTKIPAEIRNTIKGECSEVLLQCNLRDIQRVVDPSLLIKGLTVYKRGTDKTTELDVTFFTPQRIYLFECKCYAGSKVISDKGMLKGRHSSIDVYNQSTMHVEFLNSQIGMCHKAITEKGFPPYQMVLVDGTDEPFIDHRSDLNKRILPYVNFNSLDEWIYKEFRELQNQPVQWVMERVIPIVCDIKAASGAAFEQHVKRGIKGGK